MRTLIPLLALTGLLTLAAPAHAAPALTDAQIAERLVGSWQSSAAWPAGGEVVTRVTLQANGEYVTSVWLSANPDAYQLTKVGRWDVKGGWLRMQVVSSSAHDPAGRPIVDSPLQILGFGPNYVDTHAGRAWRVV